MVLGVTRSWGLSSWAFLEKVTARAGSTIRLPEMSQPAGQ